MPFCTHCGGIVRNNVCLECHKAGSGAATLTEQSSTSFSRDGPYWEASSTTTTLPAGATHSPKPASAPKPATAGAPPPSAPSPTGKIPKPDNVVVGSDGRTRNSYRNKPGQGYAGSAAVTTCMTWRPQAEAVRCMRGVTKHVRGHVMRLVRQAHRVHLLISL